MILSLLAVFLTMVLSFFLLHLIPGDPVDFMLGEGASTIDQEALKKELGLERPLYQQFAGFFSGAVKGDFGLSIYHREPVFLLVKKALKVSLLLALFSLFLSCLWGLPAALLSAIYKGLLIDKTLMALSLIAFSSPVFFTAPLLIWCFAVYWPLIPISSDGLVHYILPSVSLSLPLGSALAQMGRASILETLNQDFIRTARSKGLSFFPIYFKHALRPALSPLITVLSLQLAALLTGMIIVESIFDLPGLGLLLFKSITSRDYPLVQACVLFIAVIYLLAQLLADGAYRAAHPQARAD